MVDNWLPVALERVICAFSGAFARPLREAWTAR
jgi:hypothetical protein